MRAGMQFNSGMEAAAEIRTTTYRRCGCSHAMLFVHMGMQEQGVEIKQGCTRAVASWRLTAPGAMRLRRPAPAAQAPATGGPLDRVAAAQVLELAAVALVLAAVVVAWL